MLPEGLEEYFDIGGFEKDDLRFRIILVEKNIIPTDLSEEYRGKKVVNTVLNEKTLEKQYKENLSNFRQWEEGIDTDALVYPENFGEWMSIDETALYKGELYTVITNKDRHGKKGCLAAI